MQAREGMHARWWDGWGGRPLLGGCRCAPQPPPPRPDGTMQIRLGPVANGLAVVRTGPEATAGRSVATSWGCRDRSDRFSSPGGTSLGTGGHLQKNARSILRFQLAEFSGFRRAKIPNQPDGSSRTRLALLQSAREPCRCHASRGLPQGQLENTAIWLWWLPAARTHRQGVPTPRSTRLSDRGSGVSPHAHDRGSSRSSVGRSPTGVAVTGVRTVPGRATQIWGRVVA
jgi:hypothetical protein